jgi:hypothetical protein
LGFLHRLVDGFGFKLAVLDVDCYGSSGVDEHTLVVVVQHSPDFVDDRRMGYQQRRDSAIVENVQSFLNTRPNPGFKFIQGLSAGDGRGRVIQIFLEVCFGFLGAGFAGKVPDIQRPKAFCLADGEILFLGDDFGGFGGSFSIRADNTGERNAIEQRRQFVGVSYAFIVQGDIGFASETIRGVKNRGAVPDNIAGDDWVN